MYRSQDITNACGDYSQCCKQKQPFYQSNLESSEEIFLKLQKTNLTVACCLV